MKRNIVFLLLILIMWPVGFAGSDRHNTSQGSPSDILYASYFPRISLTSITGGLSQPLDPSTSGSILEILPTVKLEVALYGLLELDIRTDLVATNPYDPDDIDLRVAFTGPSGKEKDVGAFWYQDYDPQSHTKTGHPGWKARFTPDETGEWLAAAYAPSIGLRSAPVTFKVLPSDNRGFIRINPKNTSYLAFDNGDFFFPIGVNMAWPSDCCDPIRQYRKWLDRFAANGGNTIRVWMASWSFGIEWKDTGLGDYEKRQYEAWQLDQLFRLATEHGVKVILVLINHGAFSLNANPEWVDNPYNAAIGGPLSVPDEFTSNPIAKQYFRHRLNYIINRWGYSPELLAWEWFNEVNLTPITDRALIPWLIEMTGLLRERDINHHLTTSSFAMRTQSLIWWLPGLDIIQEHEYSSQINEKEHDLANRSVQDYQQLAATVPAKPILLGEFGYSAKNYGDDIEKTGIHLHNGLWSTTFSGYAGSGMYWWWDIYVDAHNLWQHYLGLARFLTGEDLTLYQPFSPVKIIGPDGSNAQAVGLGLQGEDTLVWLRSNGYTAQASIEARAKLQDSAQYIPPLVKDLSLILNGLESGQYTVSWFDPQKAEWLKEQTVTAIAQKLIVSVPPFRQDLAAKIARNP